MNFETKDSGERKQFASGMQRDTNTGKTRYELVFDGPMLKRWAELDTRGAVKYEARNWMKASGEAELERFRESAVRHFVQWLYGDTDEDHAAAVFFNINGAEYVKAKLEPVERRVDNLPATVKLTRPSSGLNRAGVPVPSHMGYVHPTLASGQRVWCLDCDNCDEVWAALTLEQQKKELGL